MKEKTPVSRKKILQVTALLFVIYGIVFIVSLCLGPTRISLLKTLGSFFFSGTPGLAVSDSPETAILFSIRLPRVLFASLVGASLSLAGAAFQTLLRNPLADPYILGISGGSATGAIIAIATGLSALPFGVPALAFLGAVVTIFLVFAIGRTDSNVLLLAGVIVNAFFSAVILFFLSISRSADLHSMAFWLMGDLGLATNRELLLVCLSLAVGFAVLYYHARPLNLLATGEETAVHLGVSVEKTKVLLFLAGSLITAVAVSFSGIIGFVGLVIPHMMRLAFGADHRLLFPATALFGAAYLMAADTAARVLVPSTELPVGVITALCGAPYFIWLLRRKGGV